MGAVLQAMRGLLANAILAFALSFLFVYFVPSIQEVIPLILAVIPSILSVHSNFFSTLEKDLDGFPLDKLTPRAKQIAQRKINGIWQKKIRIDWWIRLACTISTVILGSAGLLKLLPSIGFWGNALSFSLVLFIILLTIGIDRKRKYVKQAIKQIQVAAEKKETRRAEDIRRGKQSHPSI